MAEKLFRVLITGGLGFIGSNLAIECVKRGHDVIIFDNLSSFGGGNVENIRSIRSEVKLVDGDLINYEDIARNVRGVDIVFNCAASTSHPFSMREPVADLDVNGRGVLNLLEAIRRLNRGAKLVHIGTTTQLGELTSTPANESHPEFPTDVYSASKSLSEKYVLIYGKAYSIPVTVVRLPNVYGPRARIDSSDFTFVNYFIGLALQNKSLTVYGDGEQMRNLVYISDAVDALMKAAFGNQVNNEVIFATADKSVQVKEIAQSIVTHIGSGSVKMVKWPKSRKAIEVGDAVFDNSKIKKLLNWQTRVKLEDGLRKTKKYYMNRMDKYL